MKQLQSVQSTSAITSARFTYLRVGQVYESTTATGSTFYLNPVSGGQRRLYTTRRPRSLKDFAITTVFSSLPFILWWRHSAAIVFSTAGRWSSNPSIVLCSLFPIGLHVERRFRKGAMSIFWGAYPCWIHRLKAPPHIYSCSKPSFLIILKCL